MTFRTIYLTTRLLLSTLVIPLSAQDPAAARAGSIAEAKRTIQRECERAAAGNWQAWFDRLEPFRTTIRALVNAAVDNPWPNRKDPKLTYGIMRWKSDPNQYIHANTAISLGFLGKVKDPVYWAKSTPMLSTAIQARDWLGARGIDLILVPVPVKAEIYADHLITEQSLIPADKNVIPHLRRRVLAFLDENIEVVDLYPRFMKERLETNEPMYLAADTHWLQKAQRIAAEQIAIRLSRYPSIRKVQQKPPRYAEVIEKDRPTFAMFWDYLTEEEKKAIWPARLETIRNVTEAGKAAVVTSPDSPVLLVGDSYIQYDYPLSAGVVGLLAQQLNQPISVKWAPGALDEIFRDMFRDPSILRGKKVVVWLLNDEPFGRGDMWPTNFRAPR